jgi:23S rRNA G2069 N7-methylase RlmK/C1962 C5-methylase RlmI
MFRGFGFRTLYDKSGVCQILPGQIFPIVRSAVETVGQHSFASPDGFWYPMKNNRDRRSIRFKPIHLLSGFLQMMDPETLQKFEAQGEMLANRVKKRLRHLQKRFSREGIEVFRLYDWDIPEIRAVVDWYAGRLVVGEYMRRQSSPEWLPMMAAAVAKAMGIPM